MNDVAKLSGTARSTVHAVLSGKTWVSPATRKKVMDVVGRYSYRPNRLARALGKKQTHLVALILKDVMNPFNALIVEGITSVLDPAKYSTLLMSTEDDHEREVKAVEAAMSYQVDGIIITPQHVGVDFSHLWPLVHAGTPLVTLGRLPGFPADLVEMNDREAGRMATEYLASMGHRSILYLRGPSSSSAAIEREEGFKAALLDRGIRFTADMVAPAGATFEDGCEAARVFLGRMVRPSAVLCYNDLVAAGVYKAAAECSAAIPRDLSVVGIDGIELSSVFGPPLTTVVQPCREMGTAMAEILLEQMNGSATASPRSITFEPRLLARGSVRRM